MKRYLLTTALSLSTALHPAFSSAKETKGLLPEVKLSSNDEEKNQDTALKSEQLITKTELKAIESLQKIIKKKKGSPDEADLLYRLAELYMRRSKSGRFFDVNAKIPATSKQAAQSLTEALKIYDSIIARFPKYQNLDAVHFNAALASLGTKQIEKAKSHYTILTTQFTKSKMLPDALLELGELYYNQQNFVAGLEQFKRIEAFPKSKAYPYGLYKSAWCHYNMKQTELGIEKLKTVVKNNPADDPDSKKYNLRQEAIRDLTLFVGETVRPEELYTFFRKIATDDELGEVMINLAGLYESHSRHKEISIFIKEFIEKNEMSKYVAKSYAKLIEIHEVLKQRDQVLAYMRKLSDFCFEKAATEVNCKDDFRKASLEISKKWWDIWLKNKKHTEFSKLTEAAFEILLSKDDPAQPDSASRFAFAELQFQLEKYELASKNYEAVSEAGKLEASKKHDSLYGAIFSIDKLIEKDPKNGNAHSDQLMQLTLRYVKEFPKGEYLEPLTFKLGFISYQRHDQTEALKYLLPIAKSAKDQKLKLKAEDIILDIYNLNKDFKSIQAFAQSSIAGAASTERKNNLAQIKEEAHYSQIQLDVNGLDAAKKIDSLLAFSVEHKNSKLAKDALWQSISLAYANGFEVKGADLSLTYYEKFPADGKNVDAIKEAVKAYTEAGYIAKSIKTLKLLAKIEPKKEAFYLESSCDLLHVNAQIKEAQNCYGSMLDKADKKKKSDLIAKMSETFSIKNNYAEIPGLEALILKDGIEPYATQLLVTKARELLKNNKISEAFQLSLKVNSRDVNADVRAEARLIQAEILEKEFLAQSVRASESKFSMVLAMKTEKLDKAYTAYTSTIKMSKDSKIHERALLGIDRLYGNFIDSVSGMPVPNSLSPAEQKALRAELVKMTQPFVQKKFENTAKVREINRAFVSESNSRVNWASLGLDKTIEPTYNFPKATALSAFLPSQIKGDGKDFARLPAEQKMNDKKCDVKILSALSIGSCILSKRFTDAESMALQLTATKENRPVGLYYLSVIADLNNQYYKSLWLVEKAVRLEPEQSMFLYQKGKILYSKEGMATALPFFEKSFELKKISKEISLLSGLKSFSDKDYISSSEELKALSLEDQEKYSISTLLVESLAQSGNSDGAIKFGEKFLNKYPSNVDMYLQIARVHEQFSGNPENPKKAAVENYKKALAKAQDVEQRDWLKRKIGFLSEVN